VVCPTYRSVCQNSLRPTPTHCMSSEQRLVLPMQSNYFLWGTNWIFIHMRINL
jgi:hypothetical protein